jgi:hypothetical protein
MWLAAATKPAVERALFDFLISVRDGRPRADRPVITDRDTLQALYTAPHPDLREALRHCLDAFLVELTPNPSVWGPVDAPAAALGVALAGMNWLSTADGRRRIYATEDPEDEATSRDPVDEFTAALIATLPPARERDAALAYHAVLRGLPAALSASNPAAAQRSPARDRLVHALIERSPLTTLWALDVHTPAALDPLAAELLPGWDSGNRPVDVWRSAEAWLETVSALLRDPRLARWARHRWLALPETRPACRNTGLLLEALRRQDHGTPTHRDLLLAFYEYYDHARGETQTNAWGEPMRVWPLLTRMENLLTVAGDDDLLSEAALHVNRRGNEYFLKFRPLLELVVEEGGLPEAYPHLTLDFVLRLRALVPYTTTEARQRIAFEELAFEADAAPHET